MQSSGEIITGAVLPGAVFWNDPEEGLTAVLMVQMMRNPCPLREEFKALTYQAIIE